MRNIFLVLMLGFCSVALAQIPTTPKAVLSPNAANLGLYGEIPVSHFTGTPSIEIPLYELKTEYLNLPISLSYHASGVLLGIMADCRFGDCIYIRRHLGCR